MKGGGGAQTVYCIRPQVPPLLKFISLYDKKGQAMVKYAHVKYFKLVYTSTLIHLI